MFQILKSEPSQQIVYGWGSVSLADGELITDLQGDRIEPEELERAVTEFMLEYRQSGVMHEGSSIGDVVASLVTTPDVVKAFGLSDSLPVGWILGVKIKDPEVWKKVVSGELKAFSIQGTADRQEASDGDGPS
jgi:hypothetical protein